MSYKNDTTTLEVKDGKNGQLYRINEAGRWLTEYKTDSALPNGCYPIVSKFGEVIAIWTQDTLGHSVEEASAYFTPGQRFDFAEGEAVVCNGYVGRIQKVCDGQLEGMVEAGSGRSSSCVSASYPDVYPIAGCVRMSSQTG